MALKAVKSYQLPNYNTPYNDNYAGDNLSAYYGDQEAALSEYGAQTETSYAPSNLSSGSSYSASTYSSAAMTAASDSTYSSAAMSAMTRSSIGSRSTVSTDLRIRRPNESPGLSNMFGLLEPILETRAAPVEASSSNLSEIHSHWHNYNIEKSLNPKLLPDEDFSRAQVLLYAFRINYAKMKKRDIREAKEKAIQHWYAHKIQCAARQRAARLARRRKEVEREREADRQKKYADFKARLTSEGGIEMNFLDPKQKVQKSCTIYVEKEEAKFLVVKPSKGKLIKFDLMFLFKIHRGWKSRTCKLVPKLERGPKDVSFSLEGKDIVDLVCKAETMEDAIYDCEEMCMCFELIQREMNSKDSVYRDAAGNRVRVVKSVFAPPEGMKVTTAKPDPKGDPKQVTLKAMNMAKLYMIQHRFTKHRSKIKKGSESRKAKQVANEELNSAVAGAKSSVSLNAGAMGGEGDRLEVESRPSTLSNMSMHTDERDLAQDPSRWGMYQHGGNDRAFGEALSSDRGSEMHSELSAEQARQNIMSRSYGRGPGGKPYEVESIAEDDEEDEDSDDDSYYDDSDESDDEQDDGQVSYTDYTGSFRGSFLDSNGVPMISETYADSDDDEA